MRAVVMVGGVIHDSSTCGSLLRLADLIVAADGGARHVLRLGFTPHVVVGDMDSLDHEQSEHLRQMGCRFLNVLLLALPELRGVRVSLVDGQQEVTLIRGEGTIRGQVGDTVSLLPIAGDAEGITTRGLEYALHDGTLVFGRTRGVSNVLTAPTAHISVRRGALWCVHSKSS